MKKEEVLGKRLLSVFPSLSEETSTLLKVLKTKKPIYNRVQSYMNVHGKMIETVNTTLPLFVNESLIGAIEVAKDYTKTKKLAEQLAEMRSRNSIKKKQKHLEHDTSFTFDDIITENPRFIDLKEKAALVAKHSSPVLVYGESGVGKELFVQSIHHASNRSKGPFIAQNCAALPETLLESILFGTTKGSYTGAVERPGLFELADGGTLFLDEIHAMAPELQAKLLRILEDGIVRRIGGTKGKKVQVRVIAAMNVSPIEAMEKGILRKDLFYRLNVLSFEIPPLRNRKEDIPLLTKYFIHFFNRQFAKQIERVEDDVLHAFLQYSWPGNVRELKHTIEYAMNFCNKLEIKVSHLPLFWESRIKKNDSTSEKQCFSLKDKLEKIEKQFIMEALEKTGGNINQSAHLLQMPRQTLQYKLQKYQLKEQKVKHH